MEQSAGWTQSGAEPWTSVLLALGLLIVLAGIVGATSLVLHQPLLGYANNTDMPRVQAWAQIWPADAAIRPRSVLPAIETSMVSPSTTFTSWAGLAPPGGPPAA